MNTYHGRAHVHRAGTRAAIEFIGGLVILALLIFVTAGCGFLGLAILGAL